MAAKKKRKEKPSIIQLPALRIPGPDEREVLKLHDGPPRPLTREEALKILWAAKDPFGSTFGRAESFLYASTAAPVEMREWNGHGKEDTVYTVPVFTRVLVTMVSRFGDVGIRSKNIEPPSHGYDARVIPELLIDWATKP